MCRGGGLYERLIAWTNLDCVGQTFRAYQASDDHVVSGVVHYARAENGDAGDVGGNVAATNGSGNGAAVESFRRTTVGLSTSSKSTVADGGGPRHDQTLPQLNDIEDDRPTPPDCLTDSTSSSVAGDPRPVPVNFKVRETDFCPRGVLEVEDGRRHSDAPYSLSQSVGVALTRQMPAAAAKSFDRSTTADVRRARQGGRHGGADNGRSAVARLFGSSSTAQCGGGGAGGIAPVQPPYTAAGRRSLHHSWVRSTAAGLVTSRAPATTRSPPAAAHDSNHC